MNYLIIVNYFYNVTMNLYNIHVKRIYPVSVLYILKYI